MAFGNRYSYALLKDAYGITDFDHLSANKVREDRIDNYNIPDPVEEGPEKQPEGKEGFEAEIECAAVKKHCSTCGECGMQMKRYGPIGTTLNEILNIILILLVIWILIYKPSI